MMTKARFLATAIVLSAAVQLSSPFGEAAAGEGEDIPGDSAPRRHMDNLNALFGRYYEPVKVDVRPAVPACAMPLEPGGIANLREVEARLGLKLADTKLPANGFLVVPLPALRDEKGPIPKDDIVRPYKALKLAGLPVFVTADTLLHLYHVQFEESLKDIEEREFYNDVAGIAAVLTDRLATLHAAAKPNDLKEAAKKAWTYACIGRKVLDPTFDVPAAIAADVKPVLEKIDKHEGFWPQPETAHVDWPLFRYAEDFSQYVPRGHYTRSEVLKRYFLGMMWFGRMTFCLKGGEPYGPDDQPFLVSGEEARLQTMAAAMLTRLLRDEKLPDGRSLADAWRRVYTVTAFYVGLADDLGPNEYAAAVKKAAGPAPPGDALATGGFVGGGDKWRAVQLELARLSPPAIYSGTGGQGTYRGAEPAKLLEALDKSMGFRLMGQRFVPDSYWMGTLVFPTVGRPNRAGMFTWVMTANGPIRGFPRGLDVMALLGGKRARDLLTELGDDDYGANTEGQNLKYQAVFDKLKAELAALSPGDWHRNIYWAWLDALRPLLADFGEGYPSFMRTGAWRDKSLTTALASWAQLRHDTILYVKQSYTMATKGAPPRIKPVEGYVEPVPEFYARLLAMTRQTLRGLKEMEVLTGPAVERLSILETILARLLDISVKELAHKELTKEDYAFIRNFGQALEAVRVRYPEMEAAAAEAMKKRDWKEYQRISRKLDPSRSMMTTLVADVHTDQNTRQVLEEGTGHVELILVAYLQPDGRIVVGAGPVLSYYEFKHPMSDRLTDERWIEMLTSGREPQRPAWTKSYLRP